ncbi:hypothetical protein LJR175_008231 [Variovorax sp. LjRoot175]|uniref:hypothetical protein n=1 Tax=Variovorax sp. LjRoot175 TaxID=3342276 RepID=UPI003ECF9F44
MRRTFPNLFRSGDDPLVHEGGPIVFGVLGFAALAYFSITFQFTAIGVFCIPILIAQMAWTNLLYSRVRAFSSGWPRLRTLLAAEYSLTGVLFSLYGLLQGRP